MNFSTFYGLLLLLKMTTNKNSSSSNLNIFNFNNIRSPINFYKGPLKYMYVRMYVWIWGDINTYISINKEECCKYRTKKVFFTLIIMECERGQFVVCLLFLAYLYKYIWKHSITTHIHMYIGLLDFLTI